jgi:diguanylate cyclase (GGDEF)-like protein
MFISVLKDILLWTSAMEVVGAILACLIVRMVAEMGANGLLIAIPLLCIIYISHWFYLNQITSHIREIETDGLTGLPNARALRNRFDKMVMRAENRGTKLIIAMIDVDGFKSVNDQLGHQAGDALLRKLAGILSRLLRLSDFLCRYAGDEFVAILQGNSVEAPHLIKRLQRVIDRWDFGFDRTKIPIGISIGWIIYENKYSLDELLEMADSKMYEDKQIRKSKPPYAC